MQRFTSREAGFALVELVVAVLTLAILAAVVAPVLGGRVDGARVTAARVSMAEIGSAFDQYHLDTGAWPSNTPDECGIPSANFAYCGYECLYENIGKKATWQGPYSKDGTVDAGDPQLALERKTEGILDPWKLPYRVYTYAEGYDGGAGAIILLCAGQNGRVDSSVADVYADSPEADDFTWIVTRKLSVGLEE